MRISNGTDVFSLLVIVVVVIVVVLINSCIDSSSTKGDNPGKNIISEGRQIGEKRQPKPEPERCGPPLTEGSYFNEQGNEWMSVANGVVRIGRGKASFSVLPNKTNVRLFDENDLSSAHPQYLRIIDEDAVEWTRVASGASPQYQITFRRR